jgi:hypothetical protein
LPFPSYLFTILGILFLENLSGNPQIPLSYS